MKWNKGVLSARREQTAKQGRRHGELRLEGEATLESRGAEELRNGEGMDPRNPEQLSRGAPRRSSVGALHPGRTGSSAERQEIASGSVNHTPCKNSQMTPSALPF